MMNSSQAALHGDQMPFTAVRRKAGVTVFPSGQAGEGFDPENLRQKINSEEYIYGAIQRIAQVLSNELLKISRGGIYERQRKRRK
ncbi:MAG: hypothetical protein LBG07_03010 [Treponema sp.]|jgi:hypothetical protein|nr:hypothetical protein [Treponema sp.]